jgi:mannose-1-phosphate guanylyltransferase/mannose-6-phosphate isomerase
VSILHPVILSGGAGSRLWPLSRSLYPKQLLTLLSDRTMIQATALRVTGTSFGAPVVVCNDAHRFIVAEQLQEVGIVPRRLVLEPVGRNTAPAVIVAALILAEDDPDAIMVVLPSDQAIIELDNFRESLQFAARAAAAGHLVTFGIPPKTPETGYGYLRKGEALGERCFKVARFIEKPDLAGARAMLAEPGHFWNSGMFVFKATALLAEAERLCPQIYQGAAKSLAAAKIDIDFLRLDADAFTATPSQSLDYAVMEHTGRAVVVPADFAWSDVGSWSALWEIGDKDDAGNVTVGDVLTVDSRDNYLRGDGTLVAAVGLSNIVVVATEDAVLVADRAQVQNVRQIVDALRRCNRTEGDLHRKVYRPWGYHQSVDSGNRFQVKQIMVRPGARVSLRLHHHRAVHWVVVEGTALITCEDKTFLLRENESTFIPLGARHRLENPGKVPLRLVEVQSGAYLSDDDIIRLEDSFGKN